MECLVISSFYKMELARTKIFLQVLSGSKNFQKIGISKQICKNQFLTQAFQALVF